MIRAREPGFERVRGSAQVNTLYWAAVVALGIFAESKGLDKQYGKQKDYLPGMLGFDPLGADSSGMRNAEILNGRVAMMAITLYALEEAVTKAPIFPINLFRGTVAVVGDAVGDVAAAVGDAAAAVGAAVDTPALDALLAAADNAVVTAADAAAAVGSGVADVVGGM